MTEKIIKNWQVIFSLIPLLMLGGCISLLPEPGPLPKYHELSIQGVNKSIRSSRALVVQTPSAPLMLNSKNIVIQKRNPSCDSYFTILKYHQWEEELPKLIQRELVQTLRSPKWPSVSMENIGEGSSLTLRTDIINFNIIAPNQVQVKLFLSLIDTKSGKVISAEEFDSTLTTTSTVTGFMNGFNQVSSDLFSRIYQWVKKSVK